MEELTLCIEIMHITPDGTAHRCIQTAQNLQTSLRPEKLQVVSNYSLLRYFCRDGFELSVVSFNMVSIQKAASAACSKECVEINSHLSSFQQTIVKVLQYGFMLQTEHYSSWFTISFISAHAWYSQTGRVSWESNKDVFIVKIVFVSQEVINIYI